MRGSGERHGFGPGEGFGLGHGFWFGVGEALLVPLAFAVLGLCWWGGVERAQAGPAAYARDMSGAGELWLVDGFNVVQVALLAGRDRHEWWTAPYRAELLRRAGAFDGVEAADAELWVAFDGRRAATESAGPVRSVFVPSADEWVLARVRAASDPARVRVVTADRRLAARVRRRGAQVVSPAAFLGRCAVREAADAESGETTTL